MVSFLRGSYKEVGDGEVKEAIKTLISKQQEERGLLSSVVLSREAVEHTIRLCRIMVRLHAACGVSNRSIPSPLSR